MFELVYEKISKNTQILQSLIMKELTACFRQINELLTNDFIIFS